MQLGSVKRHSSSVELSTVCCSWWCDSTAVVAAHLVVGALLLSGWSQTVSDSASFVDGSPFPPHLAEGSGRLCTTCGP